MRALPAMGIGSDGSLALFPSLAHEHESSCTKRVVDLEARVARLRTELKEAEAELEREKARLPTPGDFVRCPLTNFFGRVTKVTPRPHGRPWIEIVPYLGPDLPGHSAMDLYDSWELIDPPQGGAEQDVADGSLRLPTIAPFMAMNRPALDSAPRQDDIETSLQKLWASPREISP